MREKANVAPVPKKQPLTALLSDETRPTHLFYGVRMRPFREIYCPDKDYSYCSDNREEIDSNLLRRDRFKPSIYQSIEAADYN